MARLYVFLFTLGVFALSSGAIACPEGVSRLAKIVEHEIDPSIQKTTGAAHVASGANVGSESSVLGNDARIAAAIGNSDESGDVAVTLAHEIQAAEREAAALVSSGPGAGPGGGQAGVLPDGTVVSLNTTDSLSDTQRVSRALMDNPGERERIRSLRTPRRFKILYRESTLEFDNRLFIKGIDDIPPGKKPVYFDVENSMLKQLNDEILETKDYSDAVTNLFNKTLWDKIQADPILRSKLEGRYRDFKSMRFRFLLDEGEDTADLMNRLKKAYGEAAAKFGDTVGKTGLEQLWKGRPGQAGNPEKWFLAGTGDTPLEANMAARQARGMINEMGSSNRLIQYGDRVDHLAKDVRSIESLREALSETVSLRKTGVMVDPGNGKYVLDKEAINILRKTKRGDFSNVNDYRKSVKEQLKKIYGRDVDDISVDAMTRYFEGVDSLSPPLFIRSRNGIDLSQAENGLVSVDFTGVGVDNAYEAMVGLTKTAGESGSNSQIVGKALTSVDEHVENVTDAMNRSKQAFNRGTQDVTKADKPAVFSGDDGMYFPDKPWSRSDKQKLVDQLSKTDPSKYRVTFVETTYKSGEVIPAAKRSEYIVKAEKVEKAIRKMVTGVGDGKISPERAKDMMIAIEYRPTLSGKSDWDILFGGKLSHTEQTVLRRALETVIETAN